jgi:AraC-like DNA-binding protein
MSKWSSHDVAQRIREAAHTAHRLPPVRVQGYFNLWPVFVRGEFERFANDDPPPMRFPPTPREIDRMMEVMHWMAWLEVEDRKLLWMRAERYRWEEIARRFGCSNRTAQRRWNDAVGRVVLHLNVRQGEIAGISVNARHPA